MGNLPLELIATDAGTLNTGIRSGVDCIKVYPTLNSIKRPVEDTDTIFSRPPFESMNDLEDADLHPEIEAVRRSRLHGVRIVVRSANLPIVRSIHPVPIRPEEPIAPHLSRVPAIWLTL